MPEATRYLRDSSAADLLCARHLILKLAQATSLKMLGN